MAMQGKVRLRCGVALIAVGSMAIAMPLSAQQTDDDEQTVEATGEIAATI